MGKAVLIGYLRDEAAGQASAPMQQLSEGHVERVHKKPPGFYRYRTKQREL